MWYSTWRTFVVDESKRILPWRVPGMSHRKKNCLQKASLPPCSVGQLPLRVPSCSQMNSLIMWRQPPHFLDARLKWKEIRVFGRLSPYPLPKTRRIFFPFFFRSGQTTFESHSQHGEYGWLALFSPESIYTVQWQQLVQIQAASQQRYDRRKT